MEGGPRPIPLGATSVQGYDCSANLVGFCLFYFYYLAHQVGGGEPQQPGDLAGTLQATVL